MPIRLIADAAVMAEPNFKNRSLYHGDNLAFLRGMNSRTVHLIATDPPFKKGRDFHATPNSLAAGAYFKDRWSWDKDVHPEWWDNIKDDWRGVYEVIDAAKVTYGQDMAAFLCWLGVRLIEMHRILRDDGSLYLHCDHTAHAYIKCLLDAIFGKDSFQNEFVWYYSGGGASKKRWARKHDTLLFYTKGKKWTFNADDVRTKYKWDKGQKRADGSARDYKKGKLPDDVWECHSLMPWAKERVGWPTQKPLALYERIIKASSNPGDFVLDPFCGCATTPIAAERLGRQWVGMDLWEEAYDIVLQRLQQEGLIADDEVRQSHLLPKGSVLRHSTAPIRSDDRAVAVPALALKVQIPKAAWERLSHAQIKRVLYAAQQSSGKVICAGCGRILEPEFMELDHILPKSDGGRNDISNRILLCRPCNGKKRNTLTLSGLLRANKKSGWLQNASRAKLAQSAAREKADWLRAHFDTEECQALLQG